VDLAAQLLAALHVPAAPLDAPPPLRPRAGETAAARALLSAAGVGGDYLVLAPGARFGPAKRWPPERFAAAGRDLATRWGCAAVLIGEECDRAATRAVRTAWPEAVDLAGRTDAAALIGVLAGAHAVLSNDSGAMHLAAALGRPVVGIFGSSSPHWTAPQGTRARAVSNPVWCAPCFAPTCRQDFQCMLGLASERIVAAALEAARAPRAPAASGTGR
jgi:heptosyltransferase-2